MVNMIIESFVTFVTTEFTIYTANNSNYFLFRFLVGMAMISLVIRLINRLVERG